MFGWLRRKPSEGVVVIPLEGPREYAVTIRDSLTGSPDQWTAKYSDNLDVESDLLTHKSGIMLCMNSGHMLDPSLEWFSRADRRCIREGIEAWIAHSVRRQEPST